MFILTRMLLVLVLFIGCNAKVDVDATGQNPQVPGTTSPGGSPVNEDSDTDDIDDSQNEDDPSDEQDNNDNDDDNADNDNGHGGDEGDGQDDDNDNGEDEYAGQVSQPSMSISTGTYTSSQLVEIVSETPEAVIYYTVNGQNPSAASTLYTAPILVESTLTLKAIAVRVGWLASSIVSETYTITGTVATPTFSVAEGTYASPRTVSLATTTPGATIYYTLDGQNPTSSSLQYSAPLSISETTTVKAIAILADWDNSSIASATYTIEEPAPETVIKTPQSTAVDSNYLGEMWYDITNVSVQDGNRATTYIYGMMGNSTQLLKVTNFGFEIPEGSTIKGIKVAIHRSNSYVDWGYHVQDEIIQLLRNNTLVGENKAKTATNWPMSLTTAEYGSNTDLWEEEWEAEDINDHNFGVAIRATASNGYGEVSIDVVSVTVDYEEDPMKIKKPIFSIPPKGYAGPQMVSLSTELENTTIYYTLDGSPPTRSSTVYSDPISVTETTTIRAFAIKDGYTDSSISTGVFKIATGTSCKHILDQGLSTGNGIYAVVGNETGEVYEAYCDMTTAGGGWTLCFSDGHVKKGNTLADGYDFMTAIWKHDDTYAFSSDNTSVDSYGNFCPDVMHEEVFARRFANVSTLSFTTAVFTATGNLFVDPSTRLVNGNDEIASYNKTSMTSPFYSGPTCESTSNDYAQASNLCVSSGDNFHIFMGNINSGMHGQGDYMCGYNNQCGGDWEGSVIQILVR